MSPTKVSGQSNPSTPGPSRINATNSQAIWRHRKLRPQQSTTTKNTTTVRSTRNFQLQQHRQPSIDLKNRKTRTIPIQTNATADFRIRPQLNTLDTTRHPLCTQTLEPAPPPELKLSTRERRTTVLRISA